MRAFLIASAVFLIMQPCVSARGFRPVRTRSVRPVYRQFERTTQPYHRSKQSLRSLPSNTARRRQQLESVESLGPSTTGVRTSVLKTFERADVLSSHYLKQFEASHAVGMSDKQRGPVLRAPKPGVVYDRVLSHPTRLGSYSLDPRYDVFETQTATKVCRHLQFARPDIVLRDNSTAPQWIDLGCRPLTRRLSEQVCPPDAVRFKRPGSPAFCFPRADLTVATQHSAPPTASVLKDGVLVCRPPTASLFDVVDSTPLCSFKPYLGPAGPPTSYRPVCESGFCPQSECPDGHCPEPDKAAASPASGTKDSSGGACKCTKP